MTGIVGPAATAGSFPAKKAPQTSDKLNKGKAIDGFIRRGAPSGTPVATYPGVDGRQTVLADLTAAVNSPEFRFNNLSTERYS